MGWWLGRSLLGTARFLVNYVMLTTVSYDSAHDDGIRLTLIYKEHRSIYLRKLFSSLYTDTFTEEDLGTPSTLASSYANAGLPDVGTSYRLSRS